VIPPAGEAVPARVMEEAPVAYAVPEVGETMLIEGASWLASRRTTVTVRDAWFEAESIAVIVMTRMGCVKFPLVCQNPLKSI
jgi:hypothetical protein